MSDPLTAVLLGLHDAEERVPACTCTTGSPNPGCPAYAMSARYHRRRARAILEQLETAGCLTYGRD